MNLSEFKEEIRIEIAGQKEILKRLKAEDYSIDAKNGTYYESPKYEMKVNAQITLEILTHVYKRLKKVKS